MVDTVLYVPRVDGHTHWLCFLKACLVLSSWGFSYIALQQLPISLVSPMQATRPMWTLVGALFLFGEVLNGWQWAGIVCALGSVFLFALSEAMTHRKEHAKIATAPLICLCLTILTGAASGLYDKYLMRQFDHNAVQVYYTYYQLLLITIIYLVHCYRHPAARPSQGFWRSPAFLPVICISIFLVLSDYFYLLALSDTDSLIAVVSTMRRSGTIIPFLYGIVILREPHPYKKIVCLIGILLGLVCLLLGSL